MGQVHPQSTYDRALNAPLTVKVTEVKWKALRACVCASAYASVWGARVCKRTGHKVLHTSRRFQGYAGTKGYLIQKYKNIIIY